MKSFNLMHEAERKQGGIMGKWVVSSGSGFLKILSYLWCGEMGDYRDLLGSQDVLEGD